MTHLLRLVRGLAALAVVIAVVAGTPPLLLRIGRLPPPGEFPNLFAPDDGALLLAVLTILGWLAWGAFSLSILLEAAALLTGERLRVRLPGLGAPRGLAAGLLLSIAAMLPVSAHAQPVAPAPTEAPASPEQHRIAEPPAARETGPAAPGLRYTVRRGDDLWSIAERFYGDGFAWSKIMAANPFITVPDQIEVGWELTIPGLENREPAPIDSERSASDPSQEPGTEHAPSPAHSSPPASESSDQAPDTGSVEIGSGSGDTGTAVTDIDTASAETDTAEANAGGAAPGAQERGSSESDVAPVDLAAYLTAGISSLVAAALLGRLATRRVTQLTSRGTGRRIVHPEPAAQRLEAALGRTQDPLSLRTLDLALRALGQQYREVGEELPTLGVVLVERDTVILEVDRVPDRLPIGFHADHRRLWLGQPEAEALAARAAEIAAEPSPYPALVCLGETPDGSLLLVDLESLGLVGVSGPPGAITGMLNSLVLELSSSWWGHGQSVVVIDGDAELIEALDDPSIESRTDLDAVLEELQQEAQRRNPVRADAHPRDVRSESDFTDAWRPRVVVIGRSMTESERDRLVALTRNDQAVVVAADPALAGVRLMPSPAWSDLPNGHTFHAQAMTARSRDDLLRLLRATATADTTAAPWWSAEPPSDPDDDAAIDPDDAPSAADSPDLDPAPSTAVPARSAGFARPTLAHPEWESDGATILSLAARRVAVTPEEPAVDSPEPVLHPAHPTVRLVGPVDVVGARGEQPTRAVRQCVEYAAWLLENPGATATMMATALFVAEGTRRSNMSRLRTWLGTADDGERYLPEAYSGRIQLHAAVMSDWSHMQLLTIGGVDRTAESSLVAVLELVRGAPLADAAPGQWHWAEELRTDIASLVRDVGLVLCERALERGDVDLARWAVSRALVAAAEDERLLAARVRTEHRAGNGSEVERLALRLVRSARKLNIDLADETVTMLQHVMEGRPRARGLG